MQSSTTESLWYQELNDKIAELSASFNLSETQALELSYFALNLAREQYKAGNRAGISYGMKEARNNLLAKKYIASCGIS